MAIVHFDLRYGNNEEVSAVSTFTKNGGTVVIDDNESTTINFDSTNIQDRGNFLTLLIHQKSGYKKAIVTLNGHDYPYIEPFPDSYEYVNITHKGRKYSFQTDDVLSNVVDMIGDVSIKEFIISVVKGDTVIKQEHTYCKNEAINEILNHNQIDPSVVEKKNLIYTIQKNILKGGTTIPNYLWNKVYDYSGREVAVLPNTTKKNTIKIPNLSE